MNFPVILSAVRTPIGKFMGTLASVSATQLGATAAKAAVARANIDPAEIDEVLMGQVIGAGSGQSPARQVGIYAGVPETVCATSLNKACGSGLKAVMFAAQAIKAGDGHLYLAGGMENMSATPHLVRMRQPSKYGNQELTDAAYFDGLRDPFYDWAMGISAEYIAEENEVTREAMDRFALASHQKALAAIEEGRFNDEIVPVDVIFGKTKHRVMTDESPRRDTSLAILAKLKPAFKPDGRVTAGNAPGLSDGASAIIVASQTKADAIGAKPLAKIVGYAQAATDPKRIFIAPALAIPKLLKQVNWSLADVDLIELNEAFAAQVLADGYTLASDGWDWEKVNVNGGAIALGHPIGCSGARVLTTLIYALQARGLRRGIASLCLGGGEAVAMAVEINA
jgi:acetyl-CoA C-acetyltransferase